MVCDPVIPHVTIDRPVSINVIVSTVARFTVDDPFCKFARHLQCGEFRAMQDNQIYIGGRPLFQFFVIRNEMLDDRHCELFSLSGGSLCWSEGGIMPNRRYKSGGNNCVTTRPNFKSSSTLTKRL